jgi:hypothetical protein
VQAQAQKRARRLMSFGSAVKEDSSLESEMDCDPNGSTE